MFINLNANFLAILRDSDFPIFFQLFYILPIIIFLLTYVFNEVPISNKRYNFDLAMFKLVLQFKINLTSLIQYKLQAICL